MEVFSTLDARPFVIACVMILFDVITGVIAAIVNKNFQSSKMRMGLWHKSGELCAMVLSYFLEIATQVLDFSKIGLAADFMLPASAVVCIYIVLMELGSVVENLAMITPELKDSIILKPFKKAADTVQDEDNKKEPDNGENGEN